MKYYIIAGEASGDLHGGNLIREIKKIDSKAEIRCWGGDQMQAAGGVIVKHIRELAFMGFAEVVKNLRTIFRNLKFCKEDILQFKPDALILIDYPGFNLRIAKWARDDESFKQTNAKIIYYISPQVWAWKENRVKEMKKNIDKMIVIIPFEKDYFKNKWKWDVEYVGHPLVQVIEKHKDLGTRYKVQGTGHKQDSSDPADAEASAGKQEGKNVINKRPIIALLPGSRKQEITAKLPIMLQVSDRFPDYQFVVAQAPSVDDAFYKIFTSRHPNVSSAKNQTYDLLMQAKAALVTSGTATLETALFGVPQVVCYKGSPISYQIAKRVIKVNYIAMVNLIMDKLVVKELIQKELTVDNLEKELREILMNKTRIAEIKKDYADLKRILSGGGNASENAARSVVSFLQH